MDRFISNFNNDLNKTVYSRSGKTSQSTTITQPKSVEAAPVSSVRRTNVGVPAAAIRTDSPVYIDKSGNGSHRDADGNMQQIPRQTPDAAREVFSSSGEGGPSDFSEQTVLPQTGTGYLIVQVFTARSSIPLEGAEVVVSSTQTDGGEVLILTEATDESGRTRQIGLPTPELEESEHPNAARPFSVYNISVSYPGFFTEELLNVPIFPNRTAVQPVNMVPLVGDQPEARTMSCPESSPGCRREGV